MNTLDVWIDDATLGGSARVGRLDRVGNRGRHVLSFEYAAAWLSKSEPVATFQLDPDLPLGAGQHHAHTGARTLAGVFQDSSPDRWGRLLMDRREIIEAHAEKRLPRTLNDWDYLTGVADEGRMGAMRLRDPQSAEYVSHAALNAPPVTSMRELEAIAGMIERDEEADTPERIAWMKQLIAPGASLGGARPKASMREEDGSLWIAKFPSNDDEHDVGLWEFVTYKLALQSGINMPPAALMKLSDRGHTFAVSRFDRVDGSRRAYASAMTLLATNSANFHSYLDLVLLIEEVGTPTYIARELEQLFRRVLFNILVGNRDDHLRNHGFLRDVDGWRLSPAFDINPNPAKNDHVLGINEADTTPNSDLLMATADYYRLKKSRAETIADEVRKAVDGWQSLARQLSARASEIAKMRSVMDPAR
ncbi:serine/threonine-protein kinase HipA [Dyella sp. OK004]|uniref:type II toxin-antitoxin system HipA family toxin n=1 Tax=Dyella sp. OK004 TaxID=1855292 RepID=UPI0008E082F0|nr:type II toxin-antitoxin system HipA family toxin [Dyella sp. OK004]SFR95974.1 serine/threonine-protein kinase HipA [Dyella sp. OK004]